MLPWCARCGQPMMRFACGCRGARSQRIGLLVLWGVVGCFMLWALAGCASVAEVTGDDDAAAALARCRQEARDAFYDDGASKDEALAKYDACKRREGLR